MPKISQAQRDARQNQILDAALACFSENGFHQTGMADIVKRSGLSHGAVYLYFQSKDDIIEALAVDRHRQEAILSAVGTDQAEDPIAALRKLVHAYARWLTDPDAERTRRVSVNGWSEALRNERVRAGVIEGIDAPRQMITNLIERAQSRGLWNRDANPDAIARTLVALFQGFLLQKVWNEPLDIDVIVGTVDQMVTALATAKTPTKPRKQRALER
ncbi:MAG TPA: TetR/AcrR family transcriptional regulator [Bradyrhizobium sp.]|nr:TetR/AcrR family transcriptional regulator [Bradyrhizobium sp.]